MDDQQGRFTPADEDLELPPDDDADELADTDRWSVEHLTIEERVTRLEHRQKELAFYVAQTRFACDCLFQYLTQGMAQGIPWENMGAGEGEPPPQQMSMPPNRAARRAQMRDAVRRMQEGPR